MRQSHQWHCKPEW